MLEKEKKKAEENGETSEAPATAVAVVEREELPKTIVRRLVKDKLSQLSSDSEMSVLRESLQAFSESARIFIHYLSATANDICRESKRQIINAEDVFKALEEIEFPEFAAPLRASLEEYRQKNAEKKSGLAKESNNRKGKRKEPPVAEKADKEDGNEDEEVEDSADD
ncbi:hypothetical protein M9H77_16584 [Catharanthus roseus]|uniref:Uncharacterized protein n=1 Tax=Catharanthus roseus TaxID=4058 RepID=A0ACC0B264_CATRO|nr:hypothetical protein M9H77_16584 [Catharanthus roseus]